MAAPTGRVRRRSRCSDWPRSLAIGKRKDAPTSVSDPPSTRWATTRRARRAALSTIDIAKQLQDAALLARWDSCCSGASRKSRAITTRRSRDTNRACRQAPAIGSPTPGLRNALGFLRLRRGEHEEAARQFEERLKLAAIFVQRDAEALARVGLGDVRLAKGDRDGARQMYAAAAEALRRGVPSLALHRDPAARAPSR